MILSFEFDRVSGEGSFTILSHQTGESFTGTLQAADRRHLQLLLLEVVFTQVAIEGDIALECDDLDLVEHFNLGNWGCYRQMGWKGTNGDWLRLRPLYELIDEAIAGRSVCIRLPDPKTGRECTQ